MVLFGGIEGGSSNSRIVILDEFGSVVSSAEGPHTNQWLLGIDETVRRLTELINAALKDVASPERELSHLCMALSGVDEGETTRDLLAALKAVKPEIAKTIDVCNDAIGTYLTVTNEPALVLISGTGSICSYIRKDLSCARIGGYGHLLGDGGSDFVHSLVAYWIAHQTILKFLEIEEGLIEWNCGVENVRRIIYKHFRVENSKGLLLTFYNNFDKSHIARLCEHIVQEARTKDNLCLEILHGAGVQLGRHVIAALRHATKEIPPSTNTILVICCGKVFLSWDLLRSGFCAVLRESAPRLNWSGRLSLVRLCLSAGYGAARLAARLNTTFDLPVPLDSSKLLDCIDLLTM
ncbi:N-acetyl-D-glucosamine kinase [Fasciola gigantica]|uniref:N-acetyl-D-glucosamine kinase n=1 Tax=Fasciola gigantica TaxID=46835 RepID=A0A504X398_FASGI|nr:N-acetyl-D-glucosamine kinase [Fasciola gigantica]